MDSFLLLAKSQKGAAAAKIISDVTAANGVYVFSELLALHNIAQLKDDPVNGKSYAMLELFAYGSLSDYKQSPDAYPALSSTQLNKLKQLTVVSLAHRARSLAYADLVAALDVGSIRELEDLIIDVIYADLLKGKLHHQEQVFHVEWVASRDVRLEDLPALRDKLLNFQGTASNLLAALDQEIHRARTNAQTEKDQKLAYATYRNNVYRSVLPDKSSRSGRTGASDVDQELLEPKRREIGQRLLGTRSAGFQDDGRILKKPKEDSEDTTPE